MGNEPSRTGPVRPKSQSTETTTASTTGKYPALSLPSRGTGGGGEGNGNSRVEHNESTRNGTQRSFASSASVPVRAAPHARQSSSSVRVSNPARVPTRPTAVVDPALSSMPRYVDESSVVYAPAPAEANAERGLDRSLSFSLRAVSSRIHAQASQDNVLGCTIASSPCTPSSHAFPLVAQPPSSTLVAPASPLSNLGSAPIAIPTYNSRNQIAEEMECGSPILRSYRHSSLSRADGVAAVAPSPPARTLGWSVAGMAPPGPPALASAGQGSFPFGHSVSLHAAGNGVGSSLAHGTTTATSAALVGSSKAPRHTRFLEITGCPLGLENYGNTCYANSVLQLLYHCTPLRLRLLELHEVYESKKGGAGFEDTTVLAHLCRLFALMHKTNNNSKKERWRRFVPPLQFLNKVRAAYPQFNNDAQQDAHEFAMVVLNSIIDTERCIMADPKNRTLFNENVKKKNTFAFWRSSGGEKKGNGTHDGAARPPADSLTPLQAILQGQFNSLTACLECGHVSSLEEIFMDLSLETTQGSSLLRCLHHFADPSFFYGSNKLRCKHCGQLVRAAKTLHVRQLPQYALLIHLKHFRYDTVRQMFAKNSDHVAIPTEMDVAEYASDAEDGDTPQAPPTAPAQPTETELEMSAEAKTELKRRVEAAEDAAGAPTLPESLRRRLRGVARHKARFALTGFVVHLGDGPNMGHYFTCIRYGPQLWRRFDDDIVSTMTEREVQQYFGVPFDATGMITTTAYILLYERVA